MKSFGNILISRGVILLVVIFSVMISIIGCGLTSSIDKAVSVLDRRTEEAILSFDNAIATLAQESADWRVVVANLEKEVTKDVQSTIRTEVENLTRSAIMSAGAEFRCNAEFMRIKLRRELIEIRNTLAQTVNAAIEGSFLSSGQIALIPEEPPEPFICDIVPASVDLVLDPERRSKIDIYGFDLRSLPIKVTYSGYGFFNLLKPVTVNEFAVMMDRRIRVGDQMKSIKTDAFEIVRPREVVIKDISNALSIISDFHAVLDLTESGGYIPPNAREIVLSWNNQLQSSIPIVAHIKTLECTTSEKILNPGITTFIPIPHIGNGDAEYDGNGPCVKFSMRLSLDPGRKVVSATYTMRAYECDNDFSDREPDYTDAYGSNTITLYTANSDETILSYDVQSYTYDKYIDTDTDVDSRPIGGNSPIEYLEYTGDTDGNEAGTKTGVKIHWRTIKLQVQTCGYK